MILLWWYFSGQIAAIRLRLDGLEKVARMLGGIPLSKLPEWMDQTRDRLVAVENRAGALCDLQDVLTRKVCALEARRAKPVPKKKARC